MTFLRLARQRRRQSQATTVPSPATTFVKEPKSRKGSERKEDPIPLHSPHPRNKRAKSEPWKLVHLTSTSTSTIQKHTKVEIDGGPELLSRSYGKPIRKPSQPRVIKSVKFADVIPACPVRAKEERFETEDKRRVRASGTASSEKGREREGC